MKFVLSIFFTVFLFLPDWVNGQTDLKLWYKQPAQYFEESLVLGNGQTGASVFGGVQSDMIYLNDATLWSGEPVDPNMNPEAWKNLPAIREALNQENYQLADELNKKLQGKFSESYAPLGTLFLDFKNDGPIRDYYRELDISKAVSKTVYVRNGVKYSREYFISYPDKVMVIRLTADKKGALNFSVRFNSQLKYKIQSINNMLQANGAAPVHAEPGYRGDMPDAVISDPARGTRFTTLVKIRNSGGQLITHDSMLTLKDGTSAEVFISIATSFNGFDKNPATSGLDDKKNALDHLNQAMSDKYEILFKRHLADYQKFFNRVQLNLHPSVLPDLPTDERLIRYAKGEEDKGLESLYFQYGRYLLISSSRTPGVPANLQGIWNPYMRPPWSSNYTTNINVEENYWLAENANLSEMHLPLLQFIKNVSQTGAVTARNFYGCKGWVVAHNSDIWAMSNPVGDFGKGDPNWANWNMGGAWLSTHLWEHYTFTRDTAFLKEVFPLMHGASLFCLQWMVRDQEGKLITSPSTSPENRYITPTGYKGATLYGGTADLAMIRELFMQTLKAADVLKWNANFRDSLKSALEQLHPYHTGQLGNLQEWYYDWKDEEPLHRHQSHLFGLYPGHHITPASTPELANACRKTLEMKGDETTGWSKGWRINLWARLGDGNHAYKMYRELLHYVEPDGKRTGNSGGGTYPNLFDAHPPFQIDGNFGGSAAVIEMLMQSDESAIYLLPALPDAWNDGTISGICARGGFVLSLNWENHVLKSVTITSRKGGKTVLKYKQSVKSLELNPGEMLTVKY